MTKAQRDELLDDYFQIKLFQNDFYPKDQWLEEQRRMCDFGAELYGDDLIAYQEEYARRQIKFVKKLDYKDHDMLEIRKETLGQNIICQDRQPSLLSKRPFT